MQPYHELFLNLLRASLHGEAATAAPTEAQWPQILSLAQSHKVLPLIYEAAPYPPLRQAVLQQVMQQAVKTEAFLSLYKHLQSFGFTPLVVKGIVCRSLYPKPDLRSSSDEDLLISVADFPSCHEAMCSFGMFPQSNLDAYEVPYQTEHSPLFIELHKQLFPPQSDAYGSWNRFFEGAVSRSTELTIAGTSVKTLCPTDHLFYLICHAVKHFLHSGFGIRQVCDLILFAEHYDSQIDWPQVMTNCTAIHAEVFTAALFQIGEKYLGFQIPSIFGTIQTDETLLLDDLLDSGVYGNQDLDRLHSSNITLTAASGKKGGFITSLFPPARQLEGRYPYLKEHPWLLPAAWCSRILRYSKEVTNAAESVKIGQARIALLKQYGIITKN